MDPPIHCYCGNEACVMTLWTNLNPNRRFLGSPKYKVILCLFVKFFRFTLGVFSYICLICWYRSMGVVDSSCGMMVQSVIDRSK